jgi:hypothetical protein
MRAAICKPFQAARSPASGRIGDLAGLTLIRNGT